MRLISSARLRLAVVALLLAPALLPDASPAQAPARASHAGQLLIAAPSIGDPRFAQTVILMVRHDHNGAFGIVINRPVGERPLATILEALGENSTDAAGSLRIYSGGPVQPELGFVVHSSDYRSAETMEIAGHMAMTSNREILRAIATGRGPRQSLVAFGYAGWAPGQLEAELARRDWFTTPADPRLVFETDRHKVWDDAMARRTQDL